MTTLPDKDTQLIYGWNTLERAIIGSAFNLFHIQQLLANVPNSTYAFKDRITLNTIIAKSASKFTTEINFNLANTVLPNLGIISVTKFQNDAHIVPTNTVVFDGDYVPVQPSTITDLENFFAWSCFRLNRPENVTIKPNYSLNTILFSVILPLDYKLLNDGLSDCLMASVQVNEDLPNNI